MRRLGRILLYSVLGLLALIVLAVAGGYGFLQTGTGKAWLAATIARGASTPGAVVTIEGLEGRPPFDIRVAAIRLADRDGVWLELDKVALVIDGGALLRRTLVIDRLQAAQARVLRQPVAEPTPAPARTSLDLSPPQLPLDVAVEDVGIASILLDPPVLGEPVHLTFQGRAALSRGRADAHLDLRRTDDKPGGVALDLSLDGHPAVLDIKGAIDDPRGIVAAELLKRADRPPLSIQIAGRGPIADWHGQLTAKLGSLLQLQSEIGIAAGTAYRVTLKAEAKQDGLAPPEIAPLIGDQASLAATIDYDGKAALTIDGFELAIAAGTISGKGSLDSASQRVLGDLHLSLPDLRPAQGLAGGEVAGRVDADVVLGGKLDQPTAKLAFQGAELRYTDITLDQLTMTLDLAAVGGLDRWQAKGAGKLTGLARTGEGLPAALGRDFDWAFAGSFDQHGPAVQIDSLSLEGASAKLTGQGRWAPQGTTGRFALDIAALDQFAELASLPELAGQVHLAAELEASEAGAAKVTLQGKAEALKLGVPLADALLGPEVTITGDLDRGADGALTVSTIDLAGSGITVTGQGESDAKFAQPTGTLHVELPRLADLGPALETKLQGRVTLDGELTADGETSALVLDLKGEGLGTSRPIARQLAVQVKLPALDLRNPENVSGTLTGSTSLAGPANATNARLEASFTRPDPDRISLPQVALTVGGSRIAGRLDYSLKTGLAAGTLNATIADLAPWSSLAGTPLKGSGRMTLTLAARQGQSADLKLDADSLSFGEGSGRIVTRHLALTASGRNLLATPSGEAQLTLTEVAAGQVQIGHATARANSNAAGRLGFSVEAKGAYKNPDAPAGRDSLALALDVAGDWQMRSRTQTVNLTRLNAGLAEDKASLQHPLSLSFGGGNARLQDLALSLAGGSVTGSGALQGNSLRANLAIQNLPLRPFARLAGQRVVGTLDATADLDGPASAIAGRLTLRGKGLRFPGLGSTARQLPPLDLEFAFTPGAGRMGLQGTVSALGGQLIAAKGSVPLRLSARPVAFAVPQSEALQLDVSGEGKLERLGQLLPLGEDRIAGDYKIDLAVAGTPAVPAVNGKVTVANGSYLNQDYGTELQRLALELTGDRSRLVLTRLAAHDSKSGQLQGSGSLDLAGDSPHVDVEAKLTNFLVANNDWAQAPVDAELSAKGDAASPALYGRLTIRRSEFRIPDALPPSIANLKVVEIDSRNPERTARVLAAAQKKEKTPPAVPMALDIQISAPGQIFVRGHGLDSEWRGDITVKGDSAAPAITGGLRTVRGTISLLGKDFVIQRGSITFPTGSFDEPWIDLLAEFGTSGITAQLSLTGSVQAPHLELSSTPQLPQDQILSRVLFGTDAGHMTTSQGLQLAFAAKALAAGGPGVLDQLRGTLGLDRLDIGSGSDNTGTNSSANSTLPSVSGGKYVAPGVYVGVEQGASAASSRARVEVDLLPHVTGYSSVGADSSNRLGFDWRMDY